MSIFFKQHYERCSIEELLLTIIEQNHFIISQNAKIMSTATDLEAMGDQILAGQAAEKTSLDAIKAGVATIVAGIPEEGGLSASDAAALKTKLQAILDGQNANTQEASDDAAAVAAAQPGAPAAAAPAQPAAPATDGTDTAAAAQ